MPVSLPDWAVAVLVALAVAGIVLGLRAVRALELLVALRPVEFRAMEIGAIMTFAVGALVFAVVVVPVVVSDVTVLVVVLLVRMLMVMFQVAEFEAELMRDLAPAHAARAQLEHTVERDALP